MKISTALTDETVLTELGERLAQHRVERGLTQAQLATQSGVSKRTVERIEAGASAQLSSLVRLLRTLGLLERFDSLFPPTTPGPIDLLKLHGRKRQRASTRPATTTSKQWTWGEEP